MHCRAPIDKTKATKTYFFVGMKLTRICRDTMATYVVRQLCSWCMHAECVCGQNAYTDIEQLLSITAEAYCYEGERNSLLYDPEYCIETTNEYQAAVNLEDMDPDQKVRPDMEKKGLTLLKKATLPPIKTAHYHVYFQIHLGGHDFSNDCYSVGRVRCAVRAKLEAKEPEVEIAGLRSPCVICHTSTRHKRMRERSPDDEQDSAIKRRYYFLTPTWRQLAQGYVPPASVTSTVLAPGQPPIPLEASRARIEQWIRADLQQKLLETYPDESFQPRDLTTDDMNCIMKILSSYQPQAAAAAAAAAAAEFSPRQQLLVGGATATTGTATSAAATPTAAGTSSGYATSISAQNISAELFFCFQTTWWDSISSLIAQVPRCCCARLLRPPAAAVGISRVCLFVCLFALVVVQHVYMWQCFQIYAFIDRQQAEELLQQQPIGVFLVRPSSERGFAVSVQTACGIKHIKITEQALLQLPAAELALAGSSPLMQILSTAEELFECRQFFYIGTELARHKLL